MKIKDFQQTFSVLLIRKVYNLNNLSVQNFCDLILPQMARITTDVYV
jgi:hypothetical protein